MASSIVSFAAQHIESKIKEGSNGIMKVKAEVIALLSELKNVNKLLVDAQRRTELSTSREIHSYIEELRKIAYEAEDEVDALASESSALWFRNNQASKKLRRIKERTREVNSKLDEHANQESNSEVQSRPRGTQAPKGHLPADDDIVIGIDHQITRVVNQLTGKFELNDGKKRVDSLLAIVDMGGSGKTTLARSIYNHKAIKKHFYFRAWVSVTQGWDTSTVLTDILTQIRGQRRFLFSLTNNDDGGLERDSMMLTSRLNKLLHGKNCLLILDDVWDKNSLHNFITLIQRNFDSRTYKIVITSRQSPTNSSNWHIYQPERLTEEDCWKLLSKIASNSSKALSVEYRALAMDMLGKCQGLPLAIVALGGLLKTKNTMREWQRVFYQITGTEAASMYDPVNEILGLSYDQLPYYLKPCFLYLGFFPEGSTISGGTLIRMWIAEGFVEPDKIETLEVAGTRYLQELIDHTMVQVVRKTYSGKPKTIRIHDIMRDFCILRARELDFLAVPSFVPEDIGEQSRRTAINLSKSHILPANNSQLRSLSLFAKFTARAVPERNSSQVSQRYINIANVCQKYKLLRVLDIFGINSLDGTLPTEIGNLIHLTYLRIRSTNIQLLPKSIGKLRNLLTLDYREVFVDTEVKVPNVLWKLEKLRHLYLPNEMSGSIEAMRLRTLKNLITLWGIGGGYWMLKEMSKLSPTLNKLYIHRISDEDQLKAVLSSPAMTENDRLYALALEWYGFEIKNSDSLCSKQSLQNLRLIGKAPDKSYINGRQFPSNLGKLKLYHTCLERPESMTLLGRLAFLKVLKLSNDSYIGREWSCSKDEFPTLEELKLTNLPELEKWELEKGTMRCLKKLSVVCCSKLKQMPEGLMFIRNLEELEIERMPISFTSRYLKGDCNKEARQGVDFHIIKHIPKVVIRDSWAKLIY